MDSIMDNESKFFSLHSRGVCLSLLGSKASAFLSRLLSSSADPVRNVPTISSQ